jgi:ribosomal protein S19E (S16A)
MGVMTFKQTYGTNANRSNAFGKCVSKNVKTVDEIQKTAVEQCKAAGTKPLGKCVSSARHEAEVDEQNAIENAAKQCRTERTSDPAAFKEKYGTNHNKRNAFGKCVSKRVRENEVEQEAHA